MVWSSHVTRPPECSVRCEVVRPPPPPWRCGAGRWPFGPAVRRYSWPSQTCGPAGHNQHTTPVCQVCFLLLGIPHPPHDAPPFHRSGRWAWRGSVPPSGRSHSSGGTQGAAPRMPGASPGIWCNPNPNPNPRVSGVYLVNPASVAQWAIPPFGFTRTKPSIGG